MTISNAQFTAWLDDPAALRCMLLEVTIGANGTGTPVSRYLSNKAFVSSATDTPASTAYLPLIKGGFQFSRSIDISGDVSLSFGDISLDNTDQSLDSWLDDYWVNRPFTILIGDPTWNRADFRQVFKGLTLGIDCKDRLTINIQVSDITQRLNTPISSTLLGGTTALANNLIPLTFGEAHNVSPLSTNAATNEYQVHNGNIEGIIEVRDNGVPVSFSSTPGTGKFTLTNQPYGTVTASVQGAQIPANFIESTDDFTNATKFSTSDATLSTSAVSGPYSGTSVCSVIPNTSSVAHYFQHVAFTGLNAGGNYTSSVFVKAGNSAKAEFQIIGNSGAQLSLVLDLVAGTIVLASNTAYSTGGGLIQSYGAVAAGNGWYRIWHAGSIDTTSTQTTVRVIPYSPSGGSVWVGDGSTVAAYVAGFQFEQGTFPTSYWNGDQALGVPVYRNTVAELIRLLVTNFGDTSKQFAISELDIPTFVKFDCLYRQPIGVYMTSKTNVLDLCNQIASSIGARVSVNSSNQLTLVRLDLSQSAPGTTVIPANMVEHSLQVDSLPAVVAAVNLGYCRNWTVQSSVAGGLDQTSTQMFAQEWLNAIQVDNSAATNYNLSTTATQTDSLLIVGADAFTEALRRLNMFNVQRKVLKYTGFYSLLFENLGSPQSLVNCRYVSSGKVGQIVGITVDFASSKIDFQILI
jgi:hypothetical protein